MLNKRKIIIIVSVLAVVLFGAFIYFSGLGRVAYDEVREEINEEVADHKNDLNQTRDEKDFTNSVNQDDYIGFDRAKKIALDKAGISAEQAIFEEVSLDKENGIMVYEIEFNHQNVEYSVYIDAVNGEIVKFEKDI